ncbi:MAG: hypothetical protein EA402_07605 [Planctomycetota bacterium]|nr:MAG: hypothetical protein EA402_07605 [Planctomycetota bacterium]
MSQADPARQLAWRVLEAVDDDSQLLLDTVMRRIGADVSPRDRALARELVQGSTRWGLLYDAITGALLTRPHPPLALRRALRLACHQILGMDRIPDHAIGASTGSLLRWGGHERLVGVANAVLRRLLAARIVGKEPWERLPSEMLPTDPGLRYGLPALFVRQLQQAGMAPSAIDLARCSRCPPLATRSRPGVELEDHPAMLRREGAWTWWSDPQAAIHGPVAKGEAVVQDPAQWQALQLLGEVKGRRILDVCAAPGGKSLALSEAGAWVIAADSSQPRLAPLRKLLLGRPAAEPRPQPLVADGRQSALVAAFDIVLVDAPCSNSGVWGRRPEARHRYTPEALTSLTDIQASLLRSASALVRPGGRLLYATCSLTPDENEAQVAALSGWQVEVEHRSWPDDWQAGGYACLLSRVSAS